MPRDVEDEDIKLEAKLTDPYCSVVTYRVRHEGDDEPLGPGESFLDLIDAVEWQAAGTVTELTDGGYVAAAFGRQTQEFGDVVQAARYLVELCRD